MGVFELVVNNQLNTKHWRIWLALHSHGVMGIRLPCNGNAINSTFAGVSENREPLLLKPLEHTDPAGTQVWAELLLAKQSGMPFGEMFLFPALHGLLRWFY